MFLGVASGCDLRSGRSDLRDLCFESRFQSPQNRNADLSASSGDNEGFCTVHTVSNR